MDPFIEGEFGRVLDGRLNENNRTGGQMYFNLGNISEDVVKNRRHDYENGLPGQDPPQQNTFELTEWGRVSTQQYLNGAFENSVSARRNQDVGWDGFKDEDERNYEVFANQFLNLLPGPARDQVINDPSADNFQYYLGPEQEGKSLLERYKFFNGLDGNSPVISDNSLLFTPSGSALPDNEDLNNDNTISDLEEYYEYRLDLRPDKMQIGENNIVDKVTSQDGTTDWYLFRIPIREPDKIVGDIQGFKSIRFLRTYLTGFDKPVVLRMLKFQLVGSQWRKYLESLEDPSLRELPEPEQAAFVISAVNIEENGVGGEDKVRYVVPPGIKRDLDPSSPIYRENNEQSIQLCIDDLKDRDARAAFKNVNIDLINYGRLKLFLHGHSSDAVDGDLTAFVRMGTDFTENYYEIEVPLVMTPLGLGDPSPSEVWPRENEIDVAFNSLYALKKERNRLGVDVGLPYSGTLNGPAGQSYRITVRGRPDMSTVQTLMIGVRNPEGGTRDAKSVCLWANEMRVTDFDSNAGWAANARLSTKLADFANITASTRYTTFGFGGVQQRISERTREEIREFDVSANVSLDKLLPGNFGLQVPMYVSYENSVITPQFDPLDPDIPLEAALESFETAEDRRRYRSIVEDRAIRRSINFSNVRKVKVKEDAKSHIFDIENFSFSYAYSDIQQSSVYRESYDLRSYRGSLTYNYSPEPLVVEPFKNFGFLKSPYLALIRDFNFSPLPSNLYFRGDLDRRFVKTQLRNSELNTVGIKPNYEKYFTFNRQYSLAWNLTQNLSLDYNARANAIIDEPAGDINTQEKRDSIWTNIKRFGRMKNFSQDFDVNYRLPLDKIPFTDWISTELRYSVGYTWMAGSVAQADTLGNTIQNHREQALSGKINLVKLYDKVKFLKEINNPPRRPPANQATRRNPADTTAQKPDLKLVKSTLRLMMMLRNINITYAIREGTILPGFMPAPQAFGLDSSFSAPGLAFIFGSQDPSIRRTAADNGWLAQSPFLTNPFVQNRSVDLNIRADVEPFRDLRIQFDAQKTKSASYQEIFRRDTLNGEFGYRSITPARRGNYSISFMTINTAFIPDNSENISPVFQDFESYRSVIKERLQAANQNGGEYPLNSQDVLIPAFIAAYTGQDPSDINLKPVPTIPIPNWRIDYKGLGNIPELKEIFSSVSISHAYTSRFSLNGYNNSLDYSENLELINPLEDYPLASQVNENNEYIPYYVMNQVVISERFAPLIGLNIVTRSRLQTGIQYRRERNLALNLSNTQVTEVNNKDISFTFGFTKAGMKLPFKVQGETVILDNDLSFKLDFTVRNTKTIQRKIEDVNTITSGNINFQFRPTVSYMMNQRLNLQLYFSRNINEPLITTSFPRRTTEFGVQVRFSLSQ
jgi:cell surface protein SprA